MAEAFGVAGHDRLVEKVHALTDRSGTWQETTTLVSKVNRTLDVKLDRLLHVKRDLALDMLNGSGDVVPSDFSLDDMVPANDQGRR